MSKIALSRMGPGAEEATTPRPVLGHARLCSAELSRQPQRSLPERTPTQTTWTPPRFWTGMWRFRFRYRLLSARRPPAGCLAVLGCALAPAEKTKRSSSSSSSPTVRIKRRAERSLARGPSDPQGPGLGYNEAVRFAPLLAAPLAPNPREKRQQKNKHSGGAGGRFTQHSTGLRRSRVRGKRLQRPMHPARPARPRSPTARVF